jgi:hypothetical protein
MFEELFTSGALNLVFAGTILISFVFVLLVLVGAEIGDLLDFGLDVHGDTDVDFISISPFALSIFGATFGITGLIARLWFDAAPAASIVWAAGVGLIFGGLAQAFFIYVLSPSRSSHYSLETDAVGREAEVITSIPMDGVGEIAFNNVSGRVKLAARSVTGKPIDYGEVVVIQKVVGRVAQVSRPKHNG